MRSTAPATAPNSPHPRPARRERWQAWRRRSRQDLRVFLRLFPWWPFLALVCGTLLAAALFRRTYAAEVGPMSYVQAVYGVLNMFFFQLAFTDVPLSPALDAFFVLVPLIGLPIFSIFGFNLFDVVRLFLLRGERGQQWQVALAATVDRPIVVCGLGRVGYRVACQLVGFGQPVVGVERETSALVEKLMEAGVPVILGDVRGDGVLQRAGITRAGTVVVCTNEDVVNIETTYRARELNPGVRVVLRLFDAELAEVMRRSFNVEAVLSRSAVAAQLFVQAALGFEVLENFQVANRDYVLARIPVPAHSPLAGQTVGAIGAAYDVTVVFDRQGERMLLEPEPESVVQAGDELCVFTLPERLSRLVRQDQLPRARGRSGGPILVCGVGHVGYRIVRHLLEQKQPVRAVTPEANSLTRRLESDGFKVRLGDFRRPDVLQALGIREASAVIACYEDDMVNFETALRARELNPQVRVVMRVFEEDLGERLRRTFDIDAVFSTSALATSSFVFAALGTHRAEPVRLGDRELYLMRVQVTGLAGSTVDALNVLHDLTVLLHARGGQVAIPPAPATVLAEGDELAVLASAGQLARLGQRNAAPSRAS